MRGRVWRSVRCSDERRVEHTRDRVARGDQFTESGADSERAPAGKQAAVGQSVGVPRRELGTREEALETRRVSVRGRSTCCSDDLVE